MSIPGLCFEQMISAVSEEDYHPTSGAQGIELVPLDQEHNRNFDSPIDAIDFPENISFPEFCKIIFSRPTVQRLSERLKFELLEQLVGIKNTFNFFGGLLIFVGKERGGKGKLQIQWIPHELPVGRPQDSDVAAEL
jgi:hypothetical protein